MAELFADPVAGGNELVNFSLHRDVSVLLGELRDLKCGGALRLGGLW